MKINPDEIREKINEMSVGETYTYIQSDTSWSGDIRLRKLVKFFQEIRETGEFIMTQRLVRRDGCLGIAESFTRPRSPRNQFDQ